MQNVFSVDDIVVDEKENLLHLLLVLVFVKEKICWIQCKNTFTSACKKDE